MKKFKSILAIFLAVCTLCVLSGCEFGIGSGKGSVPEADLSNLPEIEGVDFAYEIEYFNSTPLNTFHLKVGDSHTPTASVWADGTTVRHSVCYYNCLHSVSPTSISII